jgi:hypothetical protein
VEKETWALVGAAAAVAGPLIYNTVKEAVWESKKRKREERHIVIQLIFILDNYISQCAFLSYNTSRYHHPQPLRLDKELRSGLIHS